MKGIRRQATAERYSSRLNIRLSSEGPLVLADSRLVGPGFWGHGLDIRWTIIWKVPIKQAVHSSRLTLG